MKEYPINAIDNEYIEWLKAIKQQIRSSKIRMIKTVNTELIHFYWLSCNSWGIKFSQFPSCIYLC